MVDITHGIANSPRPGAPVALPAASAKRVLLLNPPVYDVRFHWHQWHQPTILLRLGTYFRKVAADVKLLDALYHRGDERLQRQRLGTVDLDGITVQRWRFGIPKQALSIAMRQLSISSWHPDAVYIECFATFWWEGAVEVIGLAKQHFPGAQVYLLGAYAEMAPDHARTHAKPDQVISELPTELAALPADLSLYTKPPIFTYVSLGGAERTPEAVVDEVNEFVRKYGVRRFAFPEHAVVTRFPKLYPAILEELARRQLRARFYALGTISPSELAEQPGLADLMRQAGYVQICFADDRDLSNDPDSGERLLADYCRAAIACHDAGFRARTEALNGALCVGRPGESLAERARMATLIAHHIGSVIVWPYQPGPDECPDVPLEGQNGKLFPFRHRNGASYRDYTDLLGLTAILNAKYRDRSFDFLGSGLIPRLFRESIARRGWDPQPDVKGPLQLPVLVRR